jgi:hypothetical protein
LSGGCIEILWGNYTSVTCHMNPVKQLLWPADNWKVIYIYTLADKKCIICIYVVVIFSTHCFCINTDLDSYFIFVYMIYNHCYYWQFEYYYSYNYYHHKKRSSWSTPSCARITLLHLPTNPLYHPHLNFQTAKFSKFLFSVTLSKFHFSTAGWRATDRPGTLWVNEMLCFSST